jgi:hypothetical protein
MDEGKLSLAEPLFVKSLDVQRRSRGRELHTLLLMGQVPQPPEQSRHVAVATATRSETLMPITCTDGYSDGKTSVLA